MSSTTTLQPQKQHRGSLKTADPPTAPNFPLSGVFEHRKRFEGHIDEVIAGRRQYTPLLPQHIASRLIHNSFDAIIAEHPLLDLPIFAALLDEQYAALVNAVLALALRFKTAPGAERELAAYPRAYYRNAATALPELLLQDPRSVRSVQALLAIALYARDVSGSRAAAVIMLTAGASLQIEMLQQGLRHGSLLLLDAAEEAQLGRAYGVACALETFVAQRYGLCPLLDGSGG
ncbi:hypothetical protein C8A01DRAFT_42268 [Parachaetomium inaequale]|uniref:Uncharacterized protein n=1 Tax=Parachaetomium inaequale TaxID=2588326 RepID=A0AAN6SL29_9PEZI|nr:hypothetical protein C8A01DRAFT_42268 [Parachaetomium inaequale]